MVPSVGMDPGVYCTWGFCNLTGRLRGTIVGPTGRSDPGYVRLVGQTSQTDRLDRL